MGEAYGFRRKRSGEFTALHNRSLTTGWLGNTGLRGSVWVDIGIFG